MTRFRIVPDRSEVRIDATSNVHGIHHTARGIEGFVDLAVDADGTVEVTGAAAEIRLAVDRLAGGNPLETRELRRRIDARRHPDITGRLTGLRATGEAGTYEAIGEVTFRGVTRPATDEIHVTPDGPDALRIEGTHAFDIRDFGMDPPRILMLHVDPVVEVHLTAVAERAG